MSALRGPIWRHAGASYYSLDAIIRHCRRTMTDLPPVAQRMVIARQRAWERDGRARGWDMRTMPEDEILQLDGWGE